MDINNNTNISSMVSQSLSRLNLNSLNRSNKVSNNVEDDVKITKETPDILNEEKAVNIQETVSKTNGVDVEEIRKYASLMGENLSIEDINYGLMYGRSVIADYSA